jgi:hypothetical protein
MEARLMGVMDSRLVSTESRLLELQKRSIGNQTEMPLAYSEMMVLFYAEKETAISTVNVTGSVEGTSGKPKFALRSLFEKTVFPRISELVKPDEEYAGYVPIIQGDNAGPH